MPGNKRGRKISFAGLRWMDGEQVLVHDITNEIFDQLCAVKVHFLEGKPKKAKRLTSKKANTDYTVIGIDLFNEEFLFTYDGFGRCINGEFECFSLQNGDD